MADILNLTQHNATPDQVTQGVREPADKEGIKTLITFVGIPSQEEIAERAQALADIAVAESAEAAMVAGAPYLMGPLESALKAAGIRPVYAFSERTSVERHEEDGTVTKTNVFKHIGFVG